jgi:hypothetical protein
MLKQGTCIYCGTFGRVEDDHVPPKQMFLKPRPKNLITVPSCKHCNSGFSKDDEYFCNVTIIRKDVKAHPKVRHLNDKVARALVRRENERFRQLLISQLEHVELTSPGGLYLGKTAVMHVQHPRICRISKRIIRGLFFHVFKSRLPDTHYVAAFNLEQVELQKELRDLLQTLVPLRFERLLQQVSRTPHAVIGENEFSYCYRQLGKDTHASAWLMTFYGASPFFGLTYSRELGNDIIVQ